MPFRHRSERCPSSFGSYTHVRIGEDPCVASVASIGGREHQHRSAPQPLAVIRVEVVEHRHAHRVQPEHDLVVVHLTRAHEAVAFVERDRAASPSPALVHAAVTPRARWKSDDQVEDHNAVPTTWYRSSMSSTRYWGM